MVDRPHSSSKNAKRWLCIAYAFPPINRSGTHRTLGFVRHLHQAGWRASVVTVAPGDEALDPDSLMAVPADTRVRRTPCVDWIARVKHAETRLRSWLGRAPASCASLSGSGYGPVSDADSPRSFRDYVSRLLTTPDSRLGWIVPAVRACRKEIRRRRPDVMYSTSPCMSAHLIALIVSHGTRIPWVADFRDPWRGNPFRSFRYRSIDWWDGWLERWVIRRADRIVCNTPTLLKRVRMRHEGARHKSVTILNAFDKECLEGLKPKRCVDEALFLMTHCGQFYGRRSPEVWFQALRRLMSAAPEVAKRFRLALIGAEDFHGRSLRDMARAAGVGDHVCVLGRMGHREAWCHMYGSDALALAGASGPASELQIPNKLFEYLALRRPILAAVDRANPAVAILHAAGAVAEVCAPDDAGAMAAAMEKLTQVDRVARRDRWQGVEAFERGRRASELIALFEGLTDPLVRRGRRIGPPASLPLGAMLLGSRRVFDDVTGPVYR